MDSSQSRLSFIAVALALVVISFTAREARHRRLEVVGQAGWVTSDADSLYQMRRLERALSEGEVAGTDAYLDHPHGARIPWPPYYTQFLAGVLGPFAPEAEPDDPMAEDARRAWIEMKVGSVPMWCGVLATLLAACAGYVLAGNLGAIVAGAQHALCTASIEYSKSGNGDHHAFVSLVAGLMLFALALALRRGGLDRPRHCLGYGLATGALAGVLLGSWVGALMYVVEVQLVLGWLVVLHARRPRAGTLPLGLGFHVAALLALLPAVLSSPWTEDAPWMAINLSWFHPAFLALGAVVFVPLLVLRRESAALRLYPVLVLVALVALGAFVARSDAAPAVGVREGFEWVSRQDAFMAGISESRALIGGEGGWGFLFDTLGYGALLLPLAWCAAAWVALRRGLLELLPWVASAPLLALQAAQQARFADALVIPMAVLLGWGAARLVARLGWREWSPLWVPVGLLLAAGLNVASVRLCIDAKAKYDQPAHVREGVSRVSVRTMGGWLRKQPRGPAEDGLGDGVLANWLWGHAIEWGGDRPSVATNFGSYIGEDSFTAPGRFFMEEDPAAAEALLAERDLRYVLLTSELPGHLELMIRTGAPERRARYVGPKGADGVLPVQPGWFRTLGARLMFDGEVFFPMGAPAGPAPESDAHPLGFLRLVHVAPLRDPAVLLRSPSDVSPAGWVWERVGGASIEARGDPGAELAVELRVRYPKARRELVFRDRAVAGPDGVASLRVPYATDRPNGDGRVDPGSAKWSFAGLDGELRVPEAAVRAGGTVRVP